MSDIMDKVVVREEQTNKLKFRTIPIEIYFGEILEEAKNRHEIEFIANNIAYCLIQAGQDALHDLGDEEYYDFELDI